MGCAGHYASYVNTFCSLCLLGLDFIVSIYSCEHGTGIYGGRDGWKADSSVFATAYECREWVLVRKLGLHPGLASGLQSDRE